MNMQHFIFVSCKYSKYIMGHVSILKFYCKPSQDTKVSHLQLLFSDILYLYVYQVYFFVSI